METKAEKQQFLELNQNKANIDELDSIRHAIDRIVLEVEKKPSFQDFETQATFQKQFAEDISKDLILKASLKDVC